MRRNYKITVKNERGFQVGKAKLLAYNRGGYLWLGDDLDNCIGWIDNRQLDAIAKAWLSVRVDKPKRKVGKA